MRHQISKRAALAIRSAFEHDEKEKKIVGSESHRTDFPELLVSRKVKGKKAAAGILGWAGIGGFDSPIPFSDGRIRHHRALPHRRH